MEENTNSSRFNFAKIYSDTLMAISTPSSTRFSISKDRIKTALNSKDAASLRDFSQYFYYASGEYRRLVHYFGNILTNDYLIIPKMDEKEMKKPAFEKAFENILSYAKNSAIHETCSQIALVVIRDGAFFGYERELDDKIAMQQLPTAFCRTRFKMNGIYTVEFDMSFFDQFTNEKDKKEMLDAYPQEFASLYNSYLSDRQTNRWQMLDPTFARAHILDDSIPLLSATFLDLIELDEYKAIDKTRSRLSIYKLLIQKLPVNKDGELTLMMEEIEDLHKNARKMVRESAIDVITTPCEIDAINLDDNASSRVMKDEVERATNTIYNSAGTPIALFNAGDNTGSIGLSASIKVDESIMFPLLRQYERWYENKFLEISPKYEFGINFPNLTIFNHQEKADQYLGAANFGFPTKLLAMTAMGIKQYEVDYLLNYENIFLDLTTRMIPTSSSYTDTGEEEGGRPESTKPLTPEGDKTKDQNKNANRAKG